MKVRRLFKAKYLRGFWVACLLLGLALFIASSAAIAAEKEDGPVKFRGTVSEAERYGRMVCYGSYYIWVTVDEILGDPQNLLQGVENLQVPYKAPLNLRSGQKVEVYGYYWTSGHSPRQCYGMVVAFGNSYYIVCIEDEYKGYLLKMLEAWCSKSEGSLYLLQTQNIELGLKGFYVLVYKERLPWEPDPALEKLMHKSVLVKGTLVKLGFEIELPTIRVKDIKEISSSERCRN